MDSPQIIRQAADANHGVLSRESDSMSTTKRPWLKEAICAVAISADFLTLDELRRLVALKHGEKVPHTTFCECLTAIRVENWRSHYVQRKQFGHARKYRIRIAKAPILSDERLAELKRDFLPILRDLIRELRKPNVERSWVQIGSLASRLEIIFNSLEDAAFLEAAKAPPPVEITPTALSGAPKGKAKFRRLEPRHERMEIN
jgi:hypothetical protein